MNTRLAPALLTSVVLSALLLANTALQSPPTFAQGGDHFSNLANSTPQQSAGLLQVAAPGRVVVDRRMGLSLTLPPGWAVLPRAKDAPVGMTLGRPSWFPRHPNQGPAPTLSIGILGRTRVTDPAQTARKWAQKLTKGLKGVRVRQRAVRYAGVPGVELVGMPGQGPTVQIILASRGTVYRFTAPGRALTRDQKSVMASLRFLSRFSNAPTV